MRDQNTELIICISCVSSKHSLIIGKHPNTPSPSLLHWPLPKHQGIATQRCDHLRKMVGKIRSGNLCRTLYFLLFPVFKKKSVAQQSLTQTDFPASFPITHSHALLQSSWASHRPSDVPDSLACRLLFSFRVLTPLSPTQTSLFLANSYLIWEVGLKHHFPRKTFQWTLPAHLPRCLVPFTLQP